MLRKKWRSKFSLRVNRLLELLEDGEIHEIFIYQMKISNEESNLYLSLIDAKDHRRSYSPGFQLPQRRASEV